MTNEALEFTAGAPFRIGDRVKLHGSPAYLKSADPMPMLRPPDLIDPDESGTVVELRALDQLAVRFRRGTFLLERGQLRPAAEGTAARSRPAAPPPAPPPDPPG